VVVTETCTINVLLPTTNMQDTLWSGYAIVPGSSVNAVGCTWIQPTVSSTGVNSLTGFWVGIDGYRGNTVEQIGTSWSLSTGYYAWVEFYGDGVQNAQGQWIVRGKYFYSVPINSIIGSNFFNIQPGDTISARVQYLSSTTTTSTFEFQFQDTPQNGQTKSWQKALTTQYVVPARSTGEWIVESPNFGSQPLANFGTISFSGAWATVGANTGPINAFTNSALNLIPSSNGGGTDYTSSLGYSNTPGPWELNNGSSSFTVTFGSANSSTANSSSMPTNAGVATSAVLATDTQMIASSNNALRWTELGNNELFAITPDSGPPLVPTWANNCGDWLSHKQQPYNSERTFLSRKTKGSGVDLGGQPFDKSSQPTVWVDAQVFLDAIFAFHYA
jgi:hypothetical protein